MKNHPLKRIFLFFLFALLYVAGSTQIKMPAALEQRLQGKTKFYEIQNEVESYYKLELQKANSNTSKKRSVERQRKFWNRWLYWAESHLDENGVVATNSAERVYQVSKAINNPTNQNARSAHGDWGFRGPANASEGVGRVNRLAFHPTNANIVYAGTSAGGLWRLTWAGSFYTWACLTNYIPELSISGIVVSHANANTIYILTGDGDAIAGGSLVSRWGYRGSSIGVLKSTDAGATWAQTGELTGASGTVLGFTLVQDPNNANTLLAATNQGIFRTTNGGNTWLRSTFADLQDDFVPNSNVAFDIQFKPGSSTIVYAAYNRSADNSLKSASIFKSTNGGSSFKEKVAFSGVNRMAIAVTPANSNYVYLVCGPGNVLNGNSSNNTFRGFYYSSNSGDNFNQQTNAPDILANVQVGFTLENQSGYDLAIAASNNNASIAMVGGLTVWKTENRGLDFDQMTDYQFSDPDDDDCIHPDVHDLAYNPLDNRLYAATDGGVSVSSDHGDHFATLFNGLQIAQFYHFEAVNEDGNMWGGTQDCGVLEQESGTQFFTRAGGDGYDVLTDRIGNNDDSYMVINTNIYDDSPIGSNNITPSGETEFFPLIAMHSTDEDIMFAGYTSRLYRSLERGDNWTGIASTSAQWALTTCPSNSSRVYCAGSRSTSVRGLFRIDAATASTPTVTNVSSALINAGYPSNFPKITDIAVNPSASTQVWITVGGFTDSAKVFYSSTSGGDWENKSGSLPNVPANCIITDAAGNTYVGTDIGVYYRNSSMNDWTPFYNDLPRVAVTGLEFLDIYNAADPANPFKYIYASTFGRGIWRSEIYTTCSPALTINQTLHGQLSFQAGTSITSTSLVNAGLGTEVYFQSGNNVTLTTGFEAFEGTVFKSMIRPCNSGPLYPARVAMLDEDLGKMINSPAETFGRIESITMNNESADLKMKINTAGNYTLCIFNERDEEVKRIVDEHFYAAGYTTKTVRTNTLPAGFYYLKLIYQNQIIHFQELEK